MKVSYTDEITSLRERLRAFIYDELLPFEEEHGIDLEKEVPLEAMKWVRERSRELGFYGITLPEAYGGKNLGLQALCVLKEELARSGAMLWGFVLGEKGGVLRIGQMLESFTPFQIEKYVRPVVDGNMNCCFALTEPNAGSDARAIETTAVKDGNEFIINGKKHFISSSPYSDYAIVICRDQIDAENVGATAFIIEKQTAGQSGFELGDLQIPISGEAETAELLFTNCRVPEENMIGERGKGLLLGLNRISQNRAIWGVTYLGVAERAFELALERVNSRQQFGRKIGEFQAIQHMLANMATEIYAARSMVYDAIERIENGDDNRAIASMVKLYTSEIAGRVVDSALQIYGGQGLMKGHPIERMYRSARMFRILTGTSEIQKNTIARDLLKGNVEIY